MSYRFMRMIVFFDLPTVTDADRREYRRFRKLLIKSGFVMMQESVYVRLVLNSTVQSLIKDQLEKGKPANGLVQCLVITEKQFSGITNISGESMGNVLDTDERLVII